MVEQIQGRYDEALKYDLEGLKLAREIDHKALQVILSLNLSNLHEDQGNYGQALLLATDAEAQSRSLDDNTLLATSRTYLGGVRLRIGDLDGADTSLAAAFKTAREMHNRTLLAEILTLQAALAEARGQREQAASVA